jgi:hypothetical protein
MDGCATYLPPSTVLNFVGAVTAATNYDPVTISVTSAPYDILATVRGLHISPIPQNANGPEEEQG